MAKKKKSDGYDIGEVIDVDLHSITRNKFLNYAVSVITSRALPDVRDGLKPVQRRILYAMYRDLKLTPDKKTLKCAKIVGQVLGNYHPHGDSAVYEALVRMAQPWSLRYPLIEGQGNFGSIDGDGAAAYRYTEAKLQRVAVPFLEEITKETVDFRSNFDDSAEEPEVLPSRIPQLLVNGCTGIAVGVATNIPPHNLNEVVEAAVYLIDNPEADTAKLVTKIKGPDFPTGGQLLEDRNTLIEIYEQGQGRIRCRGEYEIEEGKFSENNIVVTSIPYQVNKNSLVESIGQIIMDRKVPHLLDVRDESTEVIRVVLTVKKDADPETIMAYLYKHTQLRSSFHVNMTCLVPDRSQLGVRPDRLSLKEALLYFNEFRFEVTERRLKHDLRLLKERIHILKGFQIVFDDLDTALDIIRNSDGRADAAQKLMKTFPLDQKQTDAILELRLYRLGRPDVKSVLDELKEKNSQKEELEMLLDSKSRLWGVVKEEMQEMARLHGDSRRTRVLVKGAEEYSYDEQSLIVDEDATVLVSRDGWVRRVGTITDLSKARLRAGDELQYAVRGSTLSPIVFFTNYGICYSGLVNDIVQTTGYGEPIHGTFAFKDGEKIVACFILDQRVLQGSVTAQGEEEPEWQGVAMTSDGKGFRFSLQGYMESSTKNGRKFARPSGGAQVIGVKLGNPSAQLLATATRFGRGSLCKLEEVNFLSGAGKGVTVIKLERDDRVVAFQPLDEQAPEGLRLIRDEGGREIIVHPKDVKLTARAGKGQRLLKRGLLNPVVEPVRIVGPEEPSLDSNPEPVSSGSLPMKSEYDPNFDNEQLDLGLNSQDPDTNDTRDTE
ncbi:MAG: DNA topoisomerase IV subunit A [Vulcanimicrobiota bacterium]